MKNLNLLSILSVCIVMAAVACSKGNAGPAGAAGPAGPAGPDSVMHSPWITMNTVFSTTDSSYEQSITANALTSRIIDSGVVLSYIGLLTNNGDTAVFNLADASSLVAPIAQALFSGEIDLYSVSDYSGNLYRYVLVPGSLIVGNNASGKTYTRQQVQTMSYKDAVKAFGIPPVNSRN